MVIALLALLLFVSICQFHPAPGCPKTSENQFRWMFTQCMGQEPSRCTTAKSSKCVKMKPCGWGRWKELPPNRCHRFTYPAGKETKVFFEQHEDS